MMPSRPTITGRGTSLAAAFVHSIIPRKVDIEAQAQMYAHAGIDPKQCVYCGSTATDEDHLLAIVREGRPSGHFHTEGNLVPACGPCNQSKGGKGATDWMRGKAKRSPASRGVTDIEERIRRLEKFQNDASAGKKPPPSIDQMRQAADPGLWDAYWQKLDDIKAQMAQAQKDSEIIRSNLERNLG